MPRPPALLPSARMEIPRYLRPGMYFINQTRTPPPHLPPRPRIG